ncbi:hypothetical protein B0H11DRAFT_1007816 [Mycena galericulata]|nr:hypothetical protein B0H11DRAFT_595724 [Mycena galericulata]KAJ7491368.1 hypothetical protein B0H11DRAFT_1007816 [Mycena galericulata]
MRFSTIHFGAAAFVWLLTGTALAAPVASSKALLTPGGYRETANLHQVPKGGRIAHVGSDIHVFDSNGKVVNVVTPGSATKNSSAVTPYEDGWVAYASWTNTDSNPIGLFNTTWTVPPAPATWDDQTLFFFNAIQPSETGDAILQPVLQYGYSTAGGGDFWAVASWYLYGFETFYTAPVTVSVGQQLNGEIRLIGTSGGTYNYVTQFTNIPGTTLEADGVEQLTWAAETLETYDVIQASDYPTYTTVFWDINIILTDGRAPEGFSWSTVSDPADGLTTTIDVNSPLNGVVQIQY